TSKNNYAIEIRIKQIDTLSKSINRSFYQLGLSLLACVLILSGTLLVMGVNVLTIYDIPVLSWIFWGFAGYLLVRITTLRKY
ncbi:hypothetical protein NL317_30650, partial [Klebsiella pneumoniae]|nr:hypothetical protein [Klebsiella pneumoniae]